MKLKSLLTTSLALQVLFLVAQTNQPFDALQENIPFASSGPQQAPNAYVLGKFGDHPVSKFTGLPQIQIPLYTIKAGGFELPLSLSYHSGGIKVSEEASFVGLGWALSAGGVITQSVRDRNDLGLNGDFGYINNDLPMTHDVVGDENFSTYGGWQYRECEYIDYTAVARYERTSLNAEPDDCNHNAVMGQYLFGYNADTEPDIFYFSMGSYSGKFIYSKEFGRFEPLDRKQKLKIIYLGEQDGWEIIAEDGTRFDIDKKEEYHSESASPDPVSPGGVYGPDWNNYYLTKVTTYDGKVIELGYIEWSRICNLTQQSESAVVFENPWNGGEYYVDCPSCPDCDNPVECVNDPSPTLTEWLRNDYYKSLSISSYKPSYLADIVFPGGRVEFNWGTRLDIPDAQRLESIEVFSDLQAEPVKIISFDNDHYFDGGSINGYSDWVPSGFGNYCQLSAEQPAYSQDRLLKRLKLEGLQITGQDKPYQFEYNESIMLPSKMSYAQDYWGYYNGNDNATTLVPDPWKYGYYKEELDFPYSFLTKKQDRRANMNSTACILNEIIYPTGGNTKFFFEPHSFSNIELLSEYDVVEDNAHADYYKSPAYETSTFENFHLDQDQQVKIEVYVPASFDDNPYTGDVFGPENIWMRIIDTDNNVQVWEETFLEYTTSNYDCNYFDGEFFVDMVAGNYKVEVAISNLIVLGTCSGTGSGEYQVNLDVYYHKKQVSNPGSGIPHLFSTGAGLRLSKMIDDDGNGGVIEKNYTYEYESIENGQNVLKTWGEIMVKPRFYRAHDYYVYTYAGGLVGSIVNHTPFKKTLMSSPMNGLSTSLQGDYVGYDKVIETWGSTDNTAQQSGGSGSQTNGNIGSVLYDYYCVPQTCNSVSIAPCRIDPYNGSLKSITYKDVNGNLVKREEYEYIQGVIDPIREYGVMVEKNSDGYLPKDWILHFYPIRTSRVDLLSKTVKLKDQVTANWLTTVTEYDYYSNGLLKEETFTDSDGDQLITSYLYPQQLTSSSAVYTSMVTGNAINYPIEKKVKKDDGSALTTLYQQTNNYAQFGSHILLDNVESAFDGNTLEQVVDVVEYDVYNNAIEVVNRSGIHRSKLYGQEGSLLLADVTNAHHDQFYYEGFESTGYLNSEARAGLGCFSGSSCNLSWSPPDSEDYIIEYWQLNGSSEWEYHTAAYTGSLTLAGPVDEIRIYPVGAEMTTYTYDPLVGLTSINDARGYIQQYEYDDQKRLQHTYDEDGNILTRYEYRYKN